MRVKLDENMPAAMTELLRQAGHDALTVAEEGLGGIADPRILQVAAADDRVLMTFELLTIATRHPARYNAADR